MKIITYKVPAKVYRDNSGTPQLNLDESKKEKLNEEKITLNPNDIPSKAKELADENDVSRTLAKGILMRLEKEADTFLELKYLMD